MSELYFVPLVCIRISGFSLFADVTNFNDKALMFHTSVAVKVGTIEQTQATSKTDIEHDHKRQCFDIVISF